MTTTSAGKTPARAAHAATQPNGIDRAKLTVLGVFGVSGKMAALVRLPTGQVQRVVAGDRLALGHVLAIDADGVMLQRAGRTDRLGLPDS